MIDELLFFLRNINNNYANVILVILALFTFFYAYHEYVIRTRPYVIPEIALEKKDGSIYFFAVLVNKGTYPGIAKISKAELRIGDETYPTVIKQTLILSPNETKQVLQIGSINATGVNKVRGHEYQNNKVEIELTVDSKSIGDLKFKYQSSYIYQIDVSTDTPSVLIVGQTLE